MLWKWIILLSQLYLSETALLNKYACAYVPYDYTEKHVRCNGDFPDIESLKNELHNFTKSIKIFELYNASIDVLGQDIFQDIEGANVRKIIISRSSVQLLNTPEFPTSPFKSVEDTLESFEVYDSSALYAWNFSAIAPLNKLQTIIIDNSDYIYSMKGTFNDFPNLMFVQLLNSAIRWLDPDIFKNNTKLTLCSLSNNFIDKLKRSMFPKPAKYLWSLDLSYNKLNELSKDIFIEMPFLKELRLNNNHLKSLKQDVINPVWNQLSQLWFDDNGSICWTLCWISRRPNRPQFLDSSKCHLNKPILIDKFLESCSH